MAAAQVLQILSINLTKPKQVLYYVIKIIMVIAISKGKVMTHCPVYYKHSCESL